jgi:hypothetical protein
VPSLRDSPNHDNIPFEGFTGLTVTVIAIITLFIVMQMTGRVNWNEKFAKQPAVRTAS